MAEETKSLKMSNETLVNHNPTVSSQLHVTNKSMFHRINTQEPKNLKTTPEVQ